MWLGRSHLSQLCSPLIETLPSPTVSPIQALQAARRSPAVGAKLRTAKASITYDQPRRTNEIPMEKPKNHNPDNGQFAKSRIPSRSVIAPSKTAQPQCGNFNRIAVINRNMPMTVKNDANSIVHARAPAIG